MRKPADQAKDVEAAVEAFRLLAAPPRGPVAPVVEQRRVTTLEAMAASYVTQRKARRR